MKQFISFVALTLIAIAGYANDGKVNASASTNSAASAKVMNAGAVRFQFTNINTQFHADSVLVIFDRFDHTGAGVIYQVYSADQKNGIDISAIPAGKYYVTIQCMGLHHDRIEKTITIKKQKDEKINISLETSEIFTKDNVVIPVTHTKLTDLSILSNK
ncbi:MAG TPA: hypothetical protein VFE32_19355 [Puia sp.]|jgi:hypothetical protein|nr:hypothetical protein [Puia sp.]